MSSVNFELCNDISCNDYNATAVLYVNLSDFRNIFKFETSEITNNELPSTTLESSQNITYYVNSSNFPIINPSHAMMDASGSEGIVHTAETNTSNLLKHDFIYYLGKNIFGDAASARFFRNISQMKTQLETFGWSHKEYTETIFTNAYNNGDGLKNIIYSSESSNQNNIPSSSTIILSSTYEFTDPTYEDPLLITGNNGEYLFTDSGGTINDYSSSEKRAITFDAGENNTFQIMIVNLEFEAGSYYFYDRLGLTAGNNLSDLNTSASNLSLTTAPLLSDFLYETDSTNPSVVWGKSYSSSHSGNGGWLFPETHSNSSVTTDTWLDINTRYIRFYFTSDSSVHKFGWQIKIRNKNQSSTIPEEDRTDIYFKQNTDASVSPFFLFYTDKQYTNKIKKIEKNMKYRFYYNSPVNIIDSGHPFWFGSTNTHQSSLDTQITLKPSDLSRSRTAGIEPGEYLDIKVDINYTGDLFYYCTVHAAMINQFHLSYPIDNTNLTKRILEQIKEVDPSRLTVNTSSNSNSNSNSGYDIQNSTIQGSIVFDKYVHRYDWYGYAAPITLTGEYTFYDSGGSSGNYANAAKNAITFDAGKNNVIFLKIMSLSFEASTTYTYHWDRLGITAANNRTDLETDNLNSTIAPELSAFLYQSQNDDPTAGYNNRYVLDSNRQPITGGYIFPSSHLTDSVGNSNVVTDTWFKINARYVRFYFYSDSSINEPGWDIKLAPGVPSTNEPDILRKNILEKISHIADGTSINTNKNTSLTLQNVLIQKEITISEISLTGSLVNYTPPDNTTHLIYEFTTNFTWDSNTIINGEDAIIKLSTYVDSSQLNNSEYIHLKNLNELRHTHKQLIDTTDSSWSSGKTIEVKAQVLNYNYSALAHYTNLSQSSVIKPTLNLIALGTEENENSNTKSRVIEKLAFISNGSIHPTNKTPLFTTPNIRSAISVPTSLTSLYSINYIPPDDTKYIKLSFIAKMTWDDVNITINGHDSLLVWGIYVDNILIRNTLKQVTVGNLIEEDHLQTYTFDIQSDSSWSSGKTIEIKGYSIYNDYPVKIFFTNHTQSVVQPKVEITSLGDLIQIQNESQILEKIYQQSDGTNETTNVNSAQTIPISTLTEINGSSIDYTPPTDTERIIIKFKAFATWNDENITINGPDSIMKWSIYVDDQEIRQSTKYIHIGNLIEKYYTQEYVFDISSNYSNQEVEGKFSSWTTTKNIKIKGMSIYNGENPVKLHYSNVETSIVKPELTIISIGKTSPDSSSTIDGSNILNTSDVQSVPLVEGDSINYYWTLKHSNIPDRKYRIKLHLTDNTSNINTIPSDSIANTSEYPNITSHGVPTT